MDDDQLFAKVWFGFFMVLLVVVLTTLASNNEMRDKGICPGCGRQLQTEAK